MLESGLLADAGDRYELAGPLPPLAIPATLHDSLMARLDRLAPVKEVAQIGAVIGREFSHELLAAVSPLSEAGSDRRARPARRRRADLPPRHSARGRPTPSSTRWSRTPPTSRCSRAAGSSSTPGSPRTIEAGSAGEGRAPPEILAHHLTEAGLLARALPAWLAAGEQAGGVPPTGRRSRTCDGASRSRPACPGRRAGGRELRLHNLLGVALLAAHGPRPEVIEAYEQAGRLAAEAGETGELLRALWGSWFCNYLRADIPSSAVDRVRPAGPGRRDERRRLGAPGTPRRVDHRLAGWRPARGAGARRGWPAALR